MNLPDGFELTASQIAFHFDTNVQIDARRLGLFISAMSEEIARAPEFGGHAKPVLRTVTTNSPTTMTWEVVGNVAALYATIEFANRIGAQAATMTKPRWLRRLAELMEDDCVPVAQALAASPKRQLPIPINFVREQMPAVADLRAGRIAANDRSPTAFDAAPFDQDAFDTGLRRKTEAGDDRVTEDGDYLVTEDGDPIVTENGDRIKLSSAAPRAMPGTTGRAILAKPGMVAPEGLGKNLGLTGRFVSVAGWNEIVFESGDEVFEVVGGAGRDDIPVGQNVTVTAAIDWDNPGTIIISGWTSAQRVPKA